MTTKPRIKREEFERVVFTDKTKGSVFMDVKRSPKPTRKLVLIVPGVTGCSADMTI